jgi:hypothetical protein
MNDSFKNKTHIEIRHANFFDIEYQAPVIRINSISVNGSFQESGYPTNICKLHLKCTISKKNSSVLVARFSALDTRFLQLDVRISVIVP